VAEVLGVIESVAYQEFVRCIESHELRGIPQVFGDVFVKEGAHFQ
jgi:hypothetical protein